MLSIRRESPITVPFLPRTHVLAGLPRTHSTPLPPTQLGFRQRVGAFLAKLAVPAAGVVLGAMMLIGPSANASRAATLGADSVTRVGHFASMTAVDESRPAETRTVTDLRTDANKVFDERRAVPEINGIRTIERDPLDANSRAENGAKKQLEKNRPLEAAALTKLSAESRNQYESLAKCLEKRPVPRLALEILLLEGRLTKLDGSEPTLSRDSRDLLAELSNLATRDLAKGIDKTQLLAELTRECALPSAISQKYKGTCTVTAFEVCLALEDPAEYVRLVGELASPDGIAHPRDTTVELTRQPGMEKDDRSGRTISGRLFQTATMEYADGKLTYDNKSDRHSDGRSGLYLSELEQVVEPIVGTEFEVGSGVSVDSLEHMTKFLEDTLAKRGRVLGALAWGDPDEKGVIHGHHMILITGINGDRARYINPWGMEETMKVSDLKARGFQVLVRKGDAPERPIIRVPIPPARSVG